MKKFVVLVAACATALVLPAIAASKAPAAPAKTNAAKAPAMKFMWPAESLSGKIVSVDPEKRLLVVDDANGVPFDMVVTRQTHIVSGKQVLTMKDLEQDRNRSVSVKYFPERSGDVARSIRIG